MFVLVDTETTGFSPEKHQVLQLAAIILDDKLSPVSSFVTDIKHDEYLITTKALQINQIDIATHEQRAVDANTAARHFLDWLIAHQQEDERYIFAGQNCAFDRAFLLRIMQNEAMCGEYKKLVSYHSLDLINVAVFENTKGNYTFEKYNLDAIASVLSVEMPNNLQRHTALADCILELMCFQRLRGGDTLGEETVVELTSGKYVYNVFEKAQNTQDETQEQTACALQK